MTKLEIFAVNSKKIDSFTCGKKAVAGESKQAHPSILKKLKKAVLEIVPYAAAAVAYAGMMVAGNATGTDPLTSHFGASAAAGFAGMATTLSIFDKKKRDR